MAEPFQTTSLLGEDHISPMPTPEPAQQEFGDLSRVLSGKRTREGYTQMASQHGDQLSPESAPYNSPMPYTPSTPGFDDIKHLTAMRDRDAVMKHRIRYLKFSFRLFSLAAAIYSLVSMALTLSRFYATVNLRAIIRDSSGKVVTRGPWALQSKEWPTILLLSTAAVSLFLNVIVVAAYVISVRTANKTQEYFQYVTWVMAATHVGIWAPTAIAYRAGKDGNDLWGWSCSEKAKQIQPAFQSVDFNYYCNVQSAASASSFLEAGLVILSLLLWMWEYKRLKHQREMGTKFSDHYQLRESRWTKMIPTGHKI